MSQGQLSRRAFVGLGGAAAAVATVAVRPAGALGGSAATEAVGSGPASFGGRISQAQLDHYVSRVLTWNGLLSGYPEGPSDTFDDDLRVIVKVGARIIGLAAYVWTSLPNAAAEEAFFALVTERARRMHAVAPDVMLQAAVLEAVNRSVDEIPIPGWVFDEFGLPRQQRNFSYEAMLFPDGTFVNQWGPDASVPDIRQRETQMWYFYRSARYVNAGVEVMHYGQVELIGGEDTNHDAFAGFLARIRRYGLARARRHLVLATGHTHGLIRDDDSLLLDYHSYPVRPDEQHGGPDHGSTQPAVLRLGKDQQMGSLNAIYGQSSGGRTPSGWTTPSLTYSVDVDNYGGVGPNPGQPDLTSIWTWGYDEIAWFAHQPSDYRNYWLSYAFSWIRGNDPVGWLAMPGRRTLGAAPTSLPGVNIADGHIDQVTAVQYKTSMQSGESPIGFGQEDAVKAVWATPGARPAQRAGRASTRPAAESSPRSAQSTAIR